MTHIDPFAPADSGQHPANFNNPGPRGQERVVPVGQRRDDDYEDGVPFWIAIESEPIALDDPESLNKSADRWHEYDGLLQQYGTTEQQERWHTDWSTWPRDEMPTLRDLREKRDIAEAATQGAIDHPPVDDEPKDQTGELLDVQPLTDKPEGKPAKTRAAKDDDLKAKLAALEDAGL
jgi:hypothetical protein